MGRAITEIVAEGEDLRIRAALGRGDAFPSEPGEVLIDFSTPAAMPAALRWCVDSGTPFLGGTTGLAEAELAALDEAAERIPVLYAANMSLGVALMRRLVEQAAAALPETFAVELMELHHAFKVDAPSGTALALFNAVQRARPNVARVSSRDGQVGARTPAEVGVFALRGGTAAGEHTAYFLGPDERLEITHRAADRRVFARGAVRCARWLVGKPSGRYRIEDVLGEAP
jgi:4-hydroxy-tetrahydrodipicolinate reductase